MKRNKSLLLIVSLFLSFVGPCYAEADLGIKTKVLLFYVDGLRPDNVEQMVESGQLPNIEKLFFRQGLRLKNVFTVFPSNTLISNGTFMTGKWPSESGLKSQAMFERFEVEGQKHLEYVVDRFGEKQTYPRYFNLLTQTEVAPRLLKHNQIKAIYDYLGERFHSTVIPINHHPAPTPWMHVAANTVDHFYRVAMEAPEKIDDINGKYALQYMPTDRRGEVFLIWFPGLDEEQHADTSGQFGSVREALILIDRYIGEIEQEMRHSLEKGQEIISVLFSDHGAYGGENGKFNQPFYMARDYFYQELKMNVRGPDFSMTHPGTHPDIYMFVDNMGRGQSKLYFPVGDQTSGDWSKPNTFYELTHYGRGPNRTAVNLIDQISNLDLSQRNKLPHLTDPHPVDLLMFKVDADTIYLRRFDDTEALLFRHIEADGKEKYRYLPVKNFSQDAEGLLHYEESNTGDPLGYLHDSGFRVEGDRLVFLTEWHDEQEWLEATYQTQFPDAVTALWKSLGWNHALEESAAKSRNPDLVLSASPGWNFRIEDIDSADHGSLRAESMRITCMISGKGIKIGEIETPQRLIQLLPSIFEWIDYRGERDFDVQPFKDIYETAV